jgi:hypothetical protein
MERPKERGLARGACGAVLVLILIYGIVDSAGEL